LSRMLGEGAVADVHRVPAVGQEAAAELSRVVGEGAVADADSTPTVGEEAAAELSRVVGEGAVADMHRAIRGGQEAATGTGLTIGNGEGVEREYDVVVHQEDLPQTATIEGDLLPLVVQGQVLADHELWMDRDGAWTTYVEADSPSGACGANVSDQGRLSRTTGDGDKKI